MVERRHIAETLTRMSRLSVAVVGDFCVDAYWQLDARTIERSLETGKPTSSVVSQRYSLGGAGNVAANLISLGVRRVYALGIIADDLFGRELTRLLRQLRVHVGGLIEQEGHWQTPVYAKPYRKSQEQSRIDFGRKNVLSQQSTRKLIATMHEIVPKVDAVIVNQQLPLSIFSPTIIRELNTLAEKYKDKVFLVDSRHMIPRFRAMACKLNAIEAAGLFGRHVAQNELVAAKDLHRYAEHLFRQYRNSVFITRGSRGIYVRDGTAAVELPAIKVTGKVDPVGAGDTVVAALSAVLAAGASSIRAAGLAMCAAAVTVRKIRQTGTATPREILNLVRHLQAHMNPHPE